MSINVLATIPVLRILDVDTALAFYRDYLGFVVDWEHRFEPNLPVYMQISRGGIVLHLSEHDGSGTPGSVVYVRLEGVETLHRELREKGNRSYAAKVEERPWGSKGMDLVDPFGNRLRMEEAVAK
jgi:uncharacterized glyoxalase superfamily protein PhnB